MSIQRIALAAFAAVLALTGLVLAQAGPYDSIADLKLAKPEDGKDMRASRRPREQSFSLTAEPQ